MAYICMIVNEGYDWCIKSKLQLPVFKSKRTLEKIRARGKLFANDKYLSFDEQCADFNKLVEIEHKYFKNLKPYAPDFLIDDIGTGLGLAIAFEIAKRHQASIFVQSDESGTSFQIIF